MNATGQTLTSLLDHLDDPNVAGTPDVMMTGITSDSRRVVPGMGFVAVAGTGDDGHRYVGEALERGASVIFGNELGPSVGKRTFVHVPRPRRALSQLASAWYGHPSRQLKVVGITGTNGKTTVSFILRHLLRSHGEACGLIGTVRYEVGDRHIPANRTTPEPVELHRLLGDMIGVGCRHVVMEVSSHALVQERVSSVDFNLAAFTNLTRDHLDYHSDLESYFVAKRRLFEMIHPGDPGRAIILNLDDGFGRRLAKEFREVPQLSYGLQHARPLSYSAVGLRLQKHATHFTVLAGEEALDVVLPMVGGYNVQNSLAALAMGSEMGMPLSSMVEALESLPPIPGRLERLNQGQPFSVFVDYAHTADALRRVLETLRRTSSGRLLVLFGCGGGRDEGKRYEMGRIAARLADGSWITNDNPRMEAPEQIIRQILSGVQSVGGHPWNVEYDRRRAIEGILREAEPGDVVLIAGKGHETYQEIDGAVIPFDDRIYVEKALENLGFIPGEVRLAS